VFGLIGDAPSTTEGYEGEEKDLNGNACAGSPGMGAIDGSGHRKAERCCVKGQGLKPSHQSRIYIAKGSENWLQICRRTRSVGNTSYKCLQME